MYAVRTCLTLALLLVSSPALAAAPKAEWPSLSTPAPSAGGGGNDAALVMAVEDYAFVADVPGAAENARDWYLHLTKSRKVPATRVKLLRDAEVTKDSMLEAAAEVAALAKPGGTLWVVFIGHGAPAEDGRDGVLVGVDAQQTPRSLHSRSVRQKELLAALGKGKQARTVAIIDACFSGSTGSGALVPGLQPLLAVAGAAKLDAKALVLSAGKGNEFAGPLPGAARPAFSYLLLGALRGWGDDDRDGTVTAAEAVGYARAAIGMVVRGRAQTPEVAFGDGKAVLAGGAKEEGPELVAFVLERRPTEPPPAPEIRPSGPAVKGSPVTAVTADLTVDVKPREGVRLELTDPTGKSFAMAAPYKNGAAEVGRWRATAKAEGYADETQEFEVPPDETTVAKFVLKRLGGLKVTGTPAGAAVTVMGPGFAPEASGLPWEASGLRSGMYRVEVTRPGYEPFAAEATVEAGAEAEVKVELAKKGTCPAGMAYVRGGSYVLGDRKDAATVGAFCLDQTEVTVAAYAACVSSGGCTETGLACSDTYANWRRAGREQHPINCVDWTQSDAYCRAVGKRLPTEEEWEWAARGGDKGSVYPWGDAAPTNQVCWDGEGNDLGKGKRQATCRVGSYPAGAGPGGLHDLTGNVWEWTSTQGGAGRVGRGGGWRSDDPSRLRVALRGTDEVGNRSSSLGFRCARTP